MIKAVQTHFGLLVFVALAAFACTGCSEDSIITVPVQPVTASAMAAWSPDGKTLAVTWAGRPTTRKHGLYFFETSTWTSTPFLTGDGQPLFASPSWSPTGEWLAFSAGSQIWKIKANRDSLTQLTFTDNNHFCDWSSSDTMIAYVVTLGDFRGIWLMDTGGEFKRLLVRYGSNLDFAQGDSLLFIESIAPAYDSGHMVLICPKDSTTREILRWYKGPPNTSYRGSKVSIVSGRIVLSIDGDIWTLTIDGTGLTRLTTDGGYYPNWSPDGSKIVYTKPNIDGGTIWIINADGSGKTELTDW